jgi:hypothetical protein
MGSLTDFAEGKMLDHVLNNVNYSPAATLYLALCTADPTDAATGASMNEVADSGSYARTAISFAAAASRQVAQNATVTFPQASGSWGTVSHWAIVDSATHGAGNVLAHGALSASKSIVAGNTPSVASGQVTVSFNSGGISNYLANIWLDRMFRNQAFSPPTTHAALTTATIADSNTGATITEVTNANAYARKTVNPNGGSSPTWDLASSGEVDNTHAITMATATGSWGTVVAACLVDSGTHGAGNLLFYDNAIVDQAVGNGDTVEFAVGDWSNFCS